ncbi:MAG TPA: NAD(P)/FAD-dependent oxidoreductase [Campylobacterales bacterium]|nr:NAD(P)/FAD-dependent oxidoreductase [Campylobacterales bacterium]
MNRRDMIKGSLVAFVAITATPILADTVAIKAPKIVVVGGGWAGLSLVRNIKEDIPNAKVTLIEKRDHFVSCPASNSWLFDLVDLEFLTHSYIEAANNHGYDFIQATATGLDSKKDILKTTVGDIEYDYLVFATGIEYDYHEQTKGDMKLAKTLHDNYPPAFIPGSEHLTLKRKIQNFKGGNFIITVPSGNYRCLPAPYERACLLADHFKTNNIKGKVYLLDENNSITIKEEGFKTAFNKLYKDHLEYITSAKILKYDLKNKIVETEFDTISFEDASFYPNVKAPKLLEDLGLTTKTAYNRVEANIDHLTYKFKGLDNVYGCGDIRPMGFSKSGNTAYTEGQNLSKMIANTIKGKTLKWESPTTLCISLVSIKPQQEISLISEYKYGKNGETQFDSTFTDEKWKSNGLGENKAQFHWAQSMYDKMFYM